MTATGASGGFIQNLIDGLFKSGAFWGAVLSAGDPEWRAMAEDVAFWLRDHFHIKFKSGRQGRYAERIFASMRGSLERVISNKFEHEITIVILEKLLIDMPDFMVSILFANEEEFAIRRAMRARALVASGTLTQEQMERAEEAIDPLYDQLLSIARDVAKKGDQSESVPTTRTWSGERFLKMLRMPHDEADATAGDLVHERARELKDKLSRLYEAMDQKLLDLFGFNPDPELEQPVRDAKKARDRARSRRDQFHAIAMAKEAESRLNAEAERAAQAIEDANAGRPIDKKALYGRK